MSLPFVLASILLAIVIGGFVNLLSIKKLFNKTLIFLCVCAVCFNSYVGNNLILSMGSLSDCKWCNDLTDIHLTIFALVTAILMIVTFISTNKELKNKE